MIRRAPLKCACRSPLAPRRIRTHQRLACRFRAVSRARPHVPDGQEGFDAKALFRVSSRRYFWPRARTAWQLRDSREACAEPSRMPAASFPASKYAHQRSHEQSPDRRQRTRGEYIFPNVAPGTYTLKVALQGYKTYQSAGLIVGTQQFLTLDLTLEVGARGEHHGHRRHAAHRDVERVDRHGAEQRALQTLPSPGRAAFLIGASVPTVIPSGDAQFNRQQDQTNASLLSLGGGTRRGNNYTLDGVPITDLRNRAVAQPDDRSARGRQGAGAHLRRGDGPHRRRRVQHDAEVGHEQLPRHRLLPDASDLGPDEQLLQREGRAMPKPRQPRTTSAGGGFGGPIVKNRTFFWFASEDYHDVADAQRQRTSCRRRPSASGDFSRLTNAAGQPVVIYDPLTAPAVPGQHHPGEPDQPGRRGDAEVPAAARHRTSTTAAPTTTRTSLINNKFAAGIHGQGRAQVHRQGVADRLLPLQPHRRAVRELLRHRGSDRAEPLRRSERLPPEAAAADPGAEQHLGAERQLGAGAALRLTRFPDNNTLTHRLRPGDARLLVDVPRARSRVPKFPQVRIRGYDQRRHGRSARSTRPRSTGSRSSANGSFSKFVGTHTFKFGGDFRKIGVDSYIPGNGAGYFDFDKEFTSSTGSQQQHARRRQLRSPSSCSAIPSATRARQSTIDADDAARTSSPTTTAATRRTTGASARSSRSTTACASSTRTACASRTTTSRSASIRRRPARCRR